MPARAFGASDRVTETSTLAYAAPETLAEVLELLARHQDDAKLLAGGQSLLVLLRQGLVTPSVLITLRHVDELRTVAFSEDVGLSLGATVTQAQVERNEAVRQHYPALAEAASLVATRQVRNLGTIGGNLCHADPTADPPAALIALGAQLEIIGPGGTRQVAVEDFVRDFMETDLSPDEVLARVLLPPPRPAAGSAYEKHRLREVDTALVGVAVWLEVDDTGATIRDARVGLAAAGATPMRSRAAEAELRGAPATADSLARAAVAAADACEPLSDIEASEWYRRQMVRVFVQRAGSRALHRATAAHHDASQDRP
ncbi:MAG: glyceraldehyde dehydrogenase subunit beta [Chloroflexota bacterium]